MQDGTDTPLLFKDKFPFPDGKASSIPLEYLPPSEEMSEMFDLHLNNGRLLEHFEQGSMTYRSQGIKDDYAAHLCRGLAGAGGRARNHERTPRAAEVAVRAGQGAGAGDRPRQGQAALHADELDQGAGQQADQQSHGPRHAYAGLQGDGSPDERCCRNRARTRCRARTSATASARRSPASR